MKKIILVLFCFATAFVGNAKTLDCKFSLNQEGECVISDTIDIRVSRSECYRIIKGWIYTIPSVSIDFKKDVKNDSLAMSDVFYSEKRYNTFSGTYTNNLSATYEFKIMDDKLFYRISGLSLVKAYSGAGTYQNKLPVAERVTKIQKAEAEKKLIENDKTLSKADKRDKIEEQDEILADAEVLATCYDKLYERLRLLFGQLNW